MLAMEGVVFECVVEAGVDLSGRLLKNRHDHIILAEGARKRRDPFRAGPGVYVAGDAATGPGLVVRGIADGLRAAETLLRDNFEYCDQFASRQALAGVLSDA